MNQDTLLLRQIHPSFVQANSVSALAFSVTSQAFRPTQKDGYMLSVYNGDKYKAVEAYEHFTTNGDMKSAGVMAVNLLECDKENLPYTENNVPFDGHTVINFTGLTNNQIEKKAKKLRDAAIERGWLFSNL